MRDHRQPLDAIGARVVFVGPGTPAMARAFRDEHAAGELVLADPGGEAFRRAGARRSGWALLRPSFVCNLVRAMRGGFRQQGVQGDPWQHGGVLAFDGKGGLLHRQLDVTAGDPLRLGELFRDLGALPHEPGA